MSRSIFYMQIATTTALFSAVMAQSQNVVAVSEKAENKAAHGPEIKASAEKSQEWAGLSHAQIQRNAKVIVGMQATRYVKRRCQPNGKNSPVIDAHLQLGLRSDGFLLTVVRNDAPKSKGSPYEEVQKCIVQSVKMASPYHGLDPKYHDIWKTLSIRLRAGG